MPRILMELPFSPWHLQRVEDKFGQHWECTCPEYTSIKPLTARAK